MQAQLAWAVVATYAALVLWMVLGFHPPKLPKFLNRAERAYHRLVEGRANTYMRIGLPPDEARSRARRELAAEAVEVLS